MGLRSGGMTSAHETDVRGGTTEEAPEEFLAPVEAYRMLRVSARTFRRYRAAGIIRPAFTLPSGHARFRKSDVLALHAEGVTAAHLAHVAPTEAASA